MNSTRHQDSISLPFGRKILSASLPPNFRNVITARQGTEISIKTAVQDVLCHPVGCLPLKQRIRPRDNVVIVVPDKSRRCPTEEILSSLLEELEGWGAVSLSLVVAHAAHDPHPWKDLGLSPALGDRIRIYPHLARRKSELVKIGSIPAVPGGLNKSVWINKRVAEADAVIVIGSIFPHPMAGFSGGAKGIIPGVAGLRTIALNHALMFHRSSRWGVVEGNRCRADLESGAGLLPNVFLINAVYDAGKKVVGLVGGDIVAAHRKGVSLAREIGEVSVRKADMVIVSDSYPETLNIFQTLKLIVPASMIVKSGGVIICAGECPEGAGEMTLFNRLVYHLMSKSNLPPGVSVFLLCEAPSARRLPRFIKSIASLEEGITRGMRKVGQDATLAVVSGAGLVLPRIDIP